MSAFFASLTVWLTYLISLKLTKNIISGIVAALALAFSLFFWKLAVVAELFQLNLFFTALLIYIILLWKEQGEIKLFYLFAFVYGLGLTNHHTVLLLAPGFLFFIWATDRNLLKKFENYLIFALLFGLGLLPYVYLPLRSLMNPYLDWGNPENINNLINVVARTQYGGLRLDPNFTAGGFSPFVQIKVFFSWLINNFTIFGFLLGMIGMVKNIRDNVRIFGFLVILFGFSGLFFMLLSNYPFDNQLYYTYCVAILSRFMLPAMLIFALWIGIGVSWLSSKKLALLFLIIPILLFSSHYKTADKSDYYFVEDLINNILLSAKPNSILFTNGDTTLFGLWYMQQVEGKRRDIKVISSKQYSWRAEQVLARWPQLTRRAADSYDSEREFLDDLVKNNLDKIPIHSDLYHPAKFKTYGKHLAPCGLIFEFIPGASLKAKRSNMLKNRYLWKKYSFKSPLATVNQQDFFTYEILNYYAIARKISSSLY